MSWIVLSVFTQAFPQSPDTVCYNRSELRIITAKVVRATECDTLLEIAKAKAVNDSLATIRRMLIIANLNTIIANDSILLANKEARLKEANLYLSQEKKRHRWTKFGWASTTVCLSAGFVFILLRHP